MKIKNYTDEVMFWAFGVVENSDYVQYREVKMITIFNRKELLITLDMKRQSDIREILSSNSIDYVVKTTNLQSATVVGSQRAYTGNYGINQEYSYEYKIYVRKKDFNKALRLID